MTNRMLGLWHPTTGTDGSHPDHGVEVLLIVEGDEQMRMGWWDRELANTPHQFIAYGANGTYKCRATHWAHQPLKPTA